MAWGVQVPGIPRLQPGAFWPLSVNRLAGLSLLNPRRPWGAFAAGRDVGARHWLIACLAAPTETWQAVVGEPRAVQVSYPKRNDRSAASKEPASTDAKDVFGARRIMK